MRQKAWTLFGAAIGIGGVELLMVRFQVVLDPGNLHPQVAGKLQGCDALRPEIHPDRAHHVCQPVTMLAGTHVGPDRQNGHGRQVVAGQERRGWSLGLRKLTWGQA